MKAVIAVVLFFSGAAASASSRTIQMSEENSKIIFAAIGDVSVDQNTNFTQSYHSITCGHSRCNLIGDLADDEGNELKLVLRGKAAAALKEGLARLNKGSADLFCIEYRKTKQTICQMRSTT